MFILLVLYYFYSYSVHKKILPRFIHIHFSTTLSIKAFFAHSVWQKLNRGRPEIVSFVKGIVQLKKALETLLKYATPPFVLMLRLSRDVIKLVELRRT